MDGWIFLFSTFRKVKATCSNTLYEIHHIYTATIQHSYYIVHTLQVFLSLFYIISLLGLIEQFLFLLLLNILNNFLNRNICILSYFCSVQFFFPGQVNCYKDKRHLPDIIISFLIKVRFSHELVLILTTSKHQHVHTIFLNRPYNLTID